MPTSGQPKQSALFNRDVLKQKQPSPIDMTDEARVVYFHLRALGLPDSVTFEGFLSVYTLGLGGSERRADWRGDKIQTDVRSSRNGEKDEPGAERNLGHSRPMVRGKSRLRMNKDDGDSRKGRWKETLDIVAQRLVGRSEAARVRASISTATANGKVLFEDPMKIADGRRERLYRVLGSVQKEWDIENRQLMDLDRRKKELESEIGHKRRAILLLNVLEKREGFREKRIGTIGNREGEGNAGIGDLMKRLRIEATLNSQVFQDVLNGVQKELDTIISSPSLQKLQRQPSLRYKHSTNALANLHSYHFRLVHKKASTSGPNGSVEGDVNQRIENALKTLGIGNIQDTKRRIEAIARLRAERKRKFNTGGVTDSSVSEARVEELQRTNERKKQGVQEQLNRAIALGWVCEGYADLMATFREQTAPALNDSMAEERNRVEDYVDKMKMAILGQQRKPSGIFSQRVREIVGTDKVKVWEEVDEDLKYSSPKVDVMVPGPEKNLAVEVSEMDVSDISQLLERKNQKAELSYTMVEEIQGLLHGCKQLKYI